MARGPGDDEAIHQQPQQGQHANRKYDQRDQHFQKREATLLPHRLFRQLEVIDKFHDIVTNN